MNNHSQPLHPPKVRNVAPATPRMLRNASNVTDILDDYTINPEYVSQQRTPSKRLPHSQPVSEQNQNTLLPPVDLSSKPQQHQSDNTEFSNRIHSQQTQSHGHSNNNQSNNNNNNQSSNNNQSNQQFHRRSIGDWEFTKTIGAGSMGKVKLCKHRLTNEVCAVKVVTRAAKVWQRQHANDPPITDPNELLQKKKEYEKEIARDKRTIREAALGKILYHPFICRLYEMFAMSNHYYMLFEYVSGGQMLDYIVAHGSLKESQARKFARGIASALDYCHSNNIVHRDLKIENIMINNQGEIKIIDFGLSNLYSHDRLLKTYCGSLYFAAPELLSAKPYTGPEVDIWSFGVVLFVLVCGRVPFDDKSVSNLHEKIKKGQVIYPDHLSNDCVDLMKHMLVVDPIKRLSISQIILHPWMNKGYDKIVSNFLPKRIPLQLPLNDSIITEILALNLGNDEDQLKNELTDILNSQDYQNCVDNWYSKEINQHYDPNLSNPTKAYHPLISIYFLVGEMLERKREKIAKQLGDPSLSTKQIQQNPIFNATSYQPNLVHEPSKRIVTQPIPQQYQHNQQNKPPALNLQIPNVQSLQIPPAAHTSPHSDFSPHSFDQSNKIDEVSNRQANQSTPPIQQHHLEESGMNSLFRKLSTSRNSNNSKDEMKRIGSVKVTSKEKQQQVTTLSNSQSIRRNIPNHQRAISAYTGSIFNPENKNVSRTNSSNTQNSAQIQFQNQNQNQSTSIQRKYHPSARAKSVGHSRKSSYNFPKNTIHMDPNPPPLPNLLSSNNDYDGFYDDDMDNVQFSNESNKSIKITKRRPTDKEIIEQFNKAPPNSMPSIEYPKTLFLKGFFSVQTTSTKPLPVIRYDIISILPQLGVQFVEVKGGFICVHYPSIVDSLKKPTNVSQKDRSNSMASSKSPAKSNTNFSNDDYIDTIDGLKTPTISENSSNISKSKGSDDYPETPILSTPNKFGHRRKFSLGSGILGTKKSDKLSVSTNISNNANEINIPTTPAPANLMRNITDESSESLTLDETNGASDMLVSSRLEQQNQGNHSRNPSLTINNNEFDKNKTSSRTPLKFEIHIVKVPLVGLYGIQFKKISGNTWLYKSLASEILNRLNL